MRHEKYAMRVYFLQDLQQTGAKINCINFQAKNNPV